MEGAGQRDILLKPINKKPTLSIGMIVKNEERDLPKCLKSLDGVADKIVIIDTGSTDSTRHVALNTITTPVFLQTYTEASKQDETGDWKLWNFSQARNIFVDLIDADLSADHLMWMDADDILITPQCVKRALYLEAYPIVGFMIES